MISRRIQLITYLNILRKINILNKIEDYPNININIYSISMAAGITPATENISIILERNNKLLAIKIFSETIRVSQKNKYPYYIPMGQQASTEVVHRLFDA